METPKSAKPMGGPAKERSDKPMTPAEMTEENKKRVPAGYKPLSLENFCVTPMAQDWLIGQGMADTKQGPANPRAGFNFRLRFTVLKNRALNMGRQLALAETQSAVEWLKAKIAEVFDEPGCDKNQGKSEKERKKGCTKQLNPGAAAGGGPGARADCLRGQFVGKPTQQLIGLAALPHRLYHRHQRAGRDLRRREAPLQIDSRDHRKIRPAGGLCLSDPRHRAGHSRAVVHFGRRPL